MSSAPTVADLVAEIMAYIEDIMTEAEVDYPAGREAGPRISYDRDAIAARILAALATSSGWQRQDDPDMIETLIRQMHDTYCMSKGRDPSEYISRYSTTLSVIREVRGVLGYADRVAHESPPVPPYDKPATLSSAATEPVAWRARHSEAEEWQYFTSRPSWWEAQPLCVTIPSPVTVEAAVDLLVRILCVKHDEWSMSKGRDPREYLSPWSQAATALRDLERGQE